MNSKHPNIDFTMEKRAKLQNCLRLLYVLIITRSNNCFNTTVHRKPTFSGQGLSFFSNCTFRFKVNGIKTLLHSYPIYIFLFVFFP